MAGGDLPTVLVLLGCFGRGVEATGPNQTLLGMAHALAGRYDLRVVAEAVPGDVVGRWQTVAGLPQMPIPHGARGTPLLRRTIRQTPHDVLISNGFFDRTMTMPMLAMRRTGMIPLKPTFVAPHGELTPGAIDLKRGRKLAYLRAVRALGLLRGVSLVATTDEEARSIADLGAFDRPIHVWPNIYRVPPVPPRLPAEAGAPLKVVFASRIDRKKNLHFAVQALGDSGVPIQFDIFGPVSDPGYWNECRAAMAGAPPTLSVTHKGILPQADVVAALARYDLMILPTLGENFGYSIADALLAGTPILVSDRTPWRGLAAAGAGWDLPLERPDAFAQAIRRLWQMDAAAKMAQSADARAFAVRQLDLEGATSALANSLRAALGPNTESIRT